MVIALLGYVGTMVAALAVLIVVWHNVLGLSHPEAVRQLPRPIGAVAQIAPPVQQPGPAAPSAVNKADQAAQPAAAAASDARLTAAKTAEKARRLKQAREQKRKEQVARQRDDRQYSTALGYDQERSQDDAAPAPYFSLFGPRRF